MVHTYIKYQIQIYIQMHDTGFQNICKCSLLLCYLCHSLHMSDPYTITNAQDGLSISSFADSISQSNSSQKKHKMNKEYQQKQNQYLQQEMIRSCLIQSIFIHLFFCLIVLFCLNRFNQFSFLVGWDLYIDIVVFNISH